MDDVLKLHKCLIILLTEVKRICDLHNLNLFLIAGTLLGAKRHHGFIPWDDDVDVGLLRDDYEKFCTFVNKDLQPHFYITDYTNEEYYGLPYLKLRLKDTHFPEESSPKENSDGIFIDIFPIDRIPDNLLTKSIHNHALGIKRRSLLYKCKYKFDDSTINPFGRFISHLLASFLPKSYLMKLLIREQTKYNNKITSYYANLCSAYPYGREIFPCYALDSPLIYADFENLKLPIPNNAEEILTLLYGNYNQLPPANKRVFRHSNGFIDFGKYDEK